MDAADVTQLVDKLAEKLGVAVEKIQPIMIEALRQYAMRNYVVGFINAGVFILGAFITGIGYKALRKEGYRFESTDGAVSVICLASGSVTMIACIANATASFARAVSPLPAMLGF